MKHIALIFLLLTFGKAFAQTDSLPPDEDLRKAGFPTRAQLQRTEDSLRSLAKDMQTAFDSAYRAYDPSADSDQTGEEDNEKPMTLEELIEHPSHVFFLVIDLKANPIKKLPVGFENLSDLQFIIIMNLPEGASFDFEDAINKISQFSDMEDLYIMNNQKGFLSIPASIGQMTSLKRLICYNNAITQIPPEIGDLSNLEELSLEMNNLSNLPVSIGKLKKLTQLGLVKNNIQKSECSKLQTLLPQCKIICTNTN